MARRVFISFQHDDRMKAKGFNLLRWNKNVGIEFVGRHLLDPVDSDNENYIKKCIRDQLRGTSVTVVLLGEDTHESEWVQWEIEQSVSKENPNGILAIRLGPGVPLPAESPVGKTLSDAGAEIIDWHPQQFGDAIERAARTTGRVRQIAASVGTGGSSCAR